ncbi:hypothetical protein EIP86_000480 [Pleurotus ostreatoroseus]|nr:hypothetical protein EIP86_000480 [Pleurotus ostreatoroseus]
MSHPSRDSRTVRVKTNFFVVRRLPSRPFYQYDVVIKKHEADGTLKEVNRTGPNFRELIDKLFTEEASRFSPRPCYDGKKVMFSSRGDLKGAYPVSMAKDPNSNRGKYTISVEPVTAIQPSDFDNLRKQGDRGQANASATNLLQLILSQAPNLQHSFSLHSKSFYMDISRITKDLPSGLQAWRGYFQSVRPVLGQVLINIDTTTAAIPGPLLDSACIFLGCKDVRELNDRCNNPRDWQKLRGFFKNIWINAFPSRTKKRRITDLVKRAGHTEFTMDDANVTVAEYFEQHHNQRIRYPDAFGVRLGRSNVYPAELINVVPGQVYKQKLDPEDTQKFMSVSVTNPRDKLNEITQAVMGNNLDYRNSPWMREAGVDVDTRPLEIDAVELDAPKIKYGSCELGFASDLFKNLKNLGISFDQPEPLIRQGAAENADGVLDDVVRAFFSKKLCLGLVLIILPRDAAPLRKLVKQWGDMRHGIPTQCVRGGKWEKSNDQYRNNVALKINAKCGGINSTVNAPAMQFIKDAMIVGCDVSHPSPGITNKPSIASVAASVNDTATRYNAFVRLQNPRQEIITDLGDMIQRAMNQYFNSRNAWPTCLVVYRDGVSDGEYAQIEEHEVQQIEGASRLMDGSYLQLIPILSRQISGLEGIHRPQLQPAVHCRGETVTTCSPIDILSTVDGALRTVHHSLVARDGHRSCGDKKGNCRAGLVVDTEIVHPTYKDFYLQSHSGIIGRSNSSRSCFVTSTRPPHAPSRSLPLCTRLCARADFQFNPAFGLSFDETQSASSHRDGGEAFDLAAWNAAFGQAQLSDQMYFL